MKKILLSLVFATAAGLGAAELEQAGPRAGQVFQLAPDFPKYVSAHVEFRDPAGARWPSFFYGRMATNGAIRFDFALPSANAVLDCDKRPQKEGDQSRRVLGELFSGTNVVGGVRLHVTGMGPITAGADAKRTGVFQTTVLGQLEVAGRKLPVNAPASLRYNAAGRGAEKNEALMVELGFEVKAGDLGLKTFAASDPIRVRSGFTAYAADAAAKPKRK